MIYNNYLYDTRIKLLKYTSWYHYHNNDFRAIILASLSTMLAGTSRYYLGIIPVVDTNGLSS